MGFWIAPTNYQARWPPFGILNADRKNAHTPSAFNLKISKSLKNYLFYFVFVFFRFRVLGCFFFSFSTAERIRKPARLTSTRSGHSNDVTREYNITTLPKSSSSSSSSLSDPSLSVVVLLSFYNFRAYKYIMYKDVACDILFS